MRSLELVELINDKVIDFGHIEEVEKSIKTFELDSEMDLVDFLDSK